jgi:hypothetical protein
LIVRRAIEVFLRIKAPAWPCDEGGQCPLHL